MNGTKDANIQLHHTKAIDEDGYKGFSHIIYSEKGEGTRIIWKKKNAPKGSTRKTNRPLLELLKTWIEQSYFDRQVNALEIFKRLKAESSIKFRVSDIESA
ncbi:hypothetical protein J2X77_002601 [Sphingobacterium sp. 2149]|nr:hypothetical protein [Sphingobacterium sp. 2149]